jgi:hypothetical protein
VWRGPAGWATGVTGVLALGAGVSGLTPTVPGTLVGLGGLLVLGGVLGPAARTGPLRVTGWLVAAGAAELLVIATDRAVHGGLDPVSYPMAGVAALIVGTGAELTRRGRDRWAGRALAGAGHAAALVALLYAGSPLHSGVIAAGWGVVLGVRALWPGLTVPVRRLLVGVAGLVEVLACWLLLAAHHVSTVDAYTVPLALAALLAGWLVTRTRPGLGSWVAFGPALAAGLLPSLVPVLTGTASPLRRVVLGVVALAVVLAGAQLRLQAPVLLGGGVLVVLALHEIGPVVLALPTWLPLTVAGLLVLAVAVTYERRRRDLHRLRHTLSQLH